MVVAVVLGQLEARIGEDDVFEPDVLSALDADERLEKRNLDHGFFHVLALARAVVEPLFGIGEDPLAGLVADVERILYPPKRLAWRKANALRKSQPRLAVVIDFKSRRNRMRIVPEVIEDDIGICKFPFGMGIRPLDRDAVLVRQILPVHPADSGVFRGAAVWRREIPFVRRLRPFAAYAVHDDVVKAVAAARNPRNGRAPKSVPLVAPARHYPCAGQNGFPTRRAADRAVGMPCVDDKRFVEPVFTGL